MIVVLCSDRMWLGEFLRLFGDRAKGLSRKDCDFTSFAFLNRILNSIKCSVILNCTAVSEIPYKKRLDYESFAVNDLLPFNLGNLERGLGSQNEPLDGDVYRLGFKRLNL